jgi:hypothetical protein
MIEGESYVKVVPFTSIVALTADPGSTKLAWDALLEVEKDVVVGRMTVNSVVPNGPFRKTEVVSVAVEFTNGPWASDHNLSETISLPAEGAETLAVNVVI